MHCLSSLHLLGFGEANSPLPASPVHLSPVWVHGNVPGGSKGAGTSDVLRCSLPCQRSKVPELGRGGGVAGGASEDRARKRGSERASRRKQDRSAAGNWHPGRFRCRAHVEKHGNKVNTCKQQVQKECVFFAVSVCDRQGEGVCHPSPPSSAGPPWIVVKTIHTDPRMRQGARSLRLEAPPLLSFACAATAATTPAVASGVAGRAEWQSEQSGRA